MSHLFINATTNTFTTYLFISSLTSMNNLNNNNTGIDWEARRALSLPGVGMINHPPKKTNNKQQVNNKQNHPGWETYIERGAVKVRPKMSLGEMLFGGVLRLEDINTPESEVKDIRNSRKNNINLSGGFTYRQAV